MWNSTPIHLVFYKNTLDDIIKKIVEIHCKDHHETKKDMCMSLVDLCRFNDVSHTSCKGDGGDIIVDMIKDVE